MMPESAEFYDIPLPGQQLNAPCASRAVCIIYVRPGFLQIIRALSRPTQRASRIIIRFYGAARRVAFYTIITESDEGY